MEASDQSKWFTEAMKAEEIIGATDEYGDLQFLIKWKDVPQADLVPSKLANVKIPQVIWNQFFLKTDRDTVEFDGVMIRYFHHDAFI